MDFTSAVYRYCDSGVTHSKDINSIYLRSIGLLKCQEQLLKLYIPNDYDKLSKELRKEWSYNNLKHVLFINNSEGLHIIHENLQEISFFNKILYYSFRFFPRFVNYVLRKRLISNGIKC